MAHRSISVWLCWLCNAGRSKKKSAKSKLFHSIQFDPHSLLRSVHCSVNTQYWRSDNYSPSGFPCRSGIPGCSGYPSPFGFPVVLAFRSFQLCSRSDFSMVTALIFLKRRSGAYNAPRTVYVFVRNRLFILLLQAETEIEVHTIMACSHGNLTKIGVYL